MRIPSLHHLLVGAGLTVLGACGNGGLPSVTPNVSISSPTDNSTVNLSADKKVSVNFTTNYTLKAPGTCAGQDTCGHVYLLIDNTNCDQPSLPYNNLVVASPAQADFTRCAMATGMHSITLELHHDDGTHVLNLIGNPVVSQVTVTTQ